MKVGIEFELPESCAECPVSFWAFGTYCTLTQKKCPDDERRTECPLKPIPDTGKDGV
jgi:hypothetical protein